MFGLCMPTGEVYLMLKGGKKDSIEMADLTSPKKEMLQDEWVLKNVKRVGYENVEAIVYERYGNKVTIPMVEYYAEHGQELEA